MKNWKDRYGNYFQYFFWKSVNPVLDGGGRGGVILIHKAIFVPYKVLWTRGVEHILRKIKGRKK